MTDAIVIVACIALFALGHLIRDGWPPLGTTHGARALGAGVCGLGALFIAPPLVSAAIGIAVLAGFYFDRRHGEGQNAKTPADTDWLMLSGLTSVLPVALLVGAPVMLAGVVKPLIWMAAWRLIPVDTTKPARWLTPTRLAATVFGALIGSALAALQ